MDKTLRSCQSWNRLLGREALFRETGAFASEYVLNTGRQPVLRIETSEEIVQAWVLDDASLPPDGFDPAIFPRGLAWRDRFFDLWRKVQPGKLTIVDAGAHKGRITDILLADCPGGVVHAFEPNPALAARLRDKYRNNVLVQVHEAALAGESGAARLHVLERTALSSLLLQPSELARDCHGEGASVTRITQVRKVRLDEVVAAPVDVLKLDLQGCELEALWGCGRLLEGLRAVLTEISFGQPLFAELDAWLKARGFFLFGLYDLRTGDSGRLICADALYASQELLPD